MSLCILQKASRVHFQLNLPSQDIVPGGLIDLVNRGRLKQPTEETVEQVLRLNRLFDALHGKGTSLMETRNTELKTVRFLGRRCTDIDIRVIKVFVKTKYSKKIRDKASVYIRYVIWDTL